MICRLCLNDILEVINIFDEIGQELKVAFVLKKYFWFEPKCDDPISTAICNSCWLKVINFHEYYTSVEEAHRLLAERFFVKDTVPSEKEVNKEDNSSNLKEEDINDLRWDIEEITYAYPILDDDEVKPSELEENTEKDDEEFEVVDPIDNAGNDVKDEDIKPTEEDLIGDTNHRSLRSRTISRIVNSPDNESPPKIKRSPKVRKSPKLSSEKLSEKKESEYNLRAKEHDLLIAKHMKLTCEICQAVMSDFTCLRQHFWTEHKQKGYIICCNKKLFKRILLVDHINKHLDPEYFKCHDCNKSFADKQCLKNHMLVIHQSDEEKPFQCEFCAKRFIKQYLLDQHQVIHVPMEERKFHCDYCSKVFPSENTLSSHRKNSHTHENGRMCHICAKVIRGKAAFEKHQLEHKGVKQPEVQCEKCGSWLKNKHSLQKHMLRHNEEGKSFKCHVCGKIAPNQSALRSHIRYVHASERTYSCSVCDKSFKKALNLKEHMTTHTGEVLYSCPHCPKTFNSNANMHSHRKKVHPREWEANRKHRKGKITSSSSVVETLTDSGNYVQDENTES